MKAFLLLPAAALLLLFGSACSMLIRQDPPIQQQNPQKNTASSAEQTAGTQPLTDKQIAEMSPDELARYMEERKRKENARAFSEDLNSGKLSERDRRQLRGNISRPLTPEERGSAFPWKNEPGTRSESLVGTTTFGR